MPKNKPEEVKPKDPIEPSCFSKPCYRVKFSYLEGKTRKDGEFYVPAKTALEARHLVLSVCEAEEKCSIKSLEKVGESIYKIEWAACKMPAPDEVNNG